MPKSGWSTCLVLANILRLTLAATWHPASFPRARWSSGIEINRLLIFRPASALKIGNSAAALYCGDINAVTGDGNSG